jgi:chloramphenicol-sensitive protein RarD
MNKGVLYGIAAYLLWGMIPIYFKLIQSTPALQILGHRIVWSFVLLLGILTLRQEWGNFRTAAIHKKTLLVYTAAALLLAVNWGTYVWAVNAGYIVESSLGYFINPLVNVLLGVVFLRERLRPIQWAPIGLAALGVAYMTISYGQLPWIALVLAFSFGLYGLVKKVASLNSLHGLTLETALLFIPALLFLLFAEQQGVGSMGHTTLLINLLLAGTAIVTVLPLLLFGAAVRSIPLSLMGLLQYIAPTCQFLIGVLVYHEPFTQARLIGFSLIWAALIFLWAEGMIMRRRMKLLAA